MKKTVLFLVIFLIIFQALALAQFRFDPRIRWRTFQTPHCIIIYPRGEDSLAQAVGRKSERIYMRLAKIFKEEPSEKIRVVLDTSYDVLLDASTPFPNPAVYLNTTTVGLGLGHYDDWLELVISHEFTHAVDMEKRGGLSEALHKVFGRFYFPNALGPQWLTEGIATYFETALSGGGRVVDPYYDMILRMAFLEDRVTTPDQNCYFLARWPGGNSAYVFGQSYYTYIARKYGQPSVIKLRERYASSLIPFRISESVGAATGMGLKEFYRNWKADLTLHYRSQADSIRKWGITPFRQLTRSGYENRSPVWSADGKRIYYVSRDPDRHQQIRAVDVRSGREQKIKSVNVVETRMSPGGSAQREALFFSRLEWKRSYALVNDIVRLQVASGKLIPVTHGKRARDPAVSPDGKRLVYVTQRGGNSDLWLFDLERKEQRRIAAGGANRQFYHPAWSNDGERIALSVWERGGYRNIWVLELASGSMRPLLQDRAQDVSPCWSRDDRYIVFSSDRTGVFNLFAYDLETHRLLQITNLLGGAFDPAISPDGRKIAFSGYSSRGFDICVMDWQKDQPVRVHKVLLGVRIPRLPNFVYGYREETAGTDETFPERMFGWKGKKKVTPRRYSPLSSLLPRFYLPFLSADEKGTAVGAFTFGQDVLNKHSYQLLIQYGVKSRRIGYLFAYMNNSFYTPVGLSASRITVFRDRKIINETGEKESYRESRREWGAEIRLPYLKIDFSHQLLLGINFRTFSRAVDLYPGEENPYFEGNLNSWQVQYRYSSARKYPRSISPVEGVNLFTDYRQFTGMLKSNLSFYQFRTGGEAFVSLPGYPRHVLYLSGVYGLNNLQSENIIENSPQSGIRGFPLFSWRKRLLRGALEYRFPLGEIERAAPFLPVFVKRLHVALFADAAQYRDRFYRQHRIGSIGLELRLDAVYGYLLDGGLRAGVAFPVKSEREWSAYFSVVLN